MQPVLVPTALVVILLGMGAPGVAGGEDLTDPIRPAGTYCPILRDTDPTWVAYDEAGCWEHCVLRTQCVVLNLVLRKGQCSDDPAGTRSCIANATGYASAHNWVTPGRFTITVTGVCENEGSASWLVGGTDVTVTSCEKVITVDANHCVNLWANAQLDASGPVAPDNPESAAGLRVCAD